MKPELMGILPFPARTEIDFENERISFSYLYQNELDSEFKIFYALLRMWMAWISTFAIILFFVLIAISGSFGTNTITILAKLLLTSFLISIALTILHMKTPLQKYLKQVIPRLYEMINRHRFNWKKIESTNGKKIIVPLQRCMVMEWDAKEEFKENLSKVEVKEICYFTDRKGKKTNGDYFAIFTFNKRPEKGDLFVRWY